MPTPWTTFFTAPTVRSRSINAENPTGAPGAAAGARSPLGPSRKGRPCLPLPAGGSLQLADIEGPGVVRHIWITVPEATAAGPFVLRDLVLRMYWDDEPDPAVEVPLGDFFCNGFGTRALVTSEPIVVAPTGGMNSYFAMPFARRARIVLDSEHAGDVGMVFFQIDYTVGDELPDDPATFHAEWRRSNGTLTKGEDHVILDGVRGAGHYVGTYLAVAALERFWWGEGEVKFFLDGDNALPTQVTTGLEDYAGGAWAFQDALRANPAPVPIVFSAPYFGYPHHSTADATRASPFATATAPQHGLYRWHLLDPITFGSRVRATVQQIGAWDHGLFERSDDIATVAYWYQQGTRVGRPTLPSVGERTPR